MKTIVFLVAVLSIISCSESILDKESTSNVNPIDNEAVKLKKIEEIREKLTGSWRSTHFFYSDGSKGRHYMPEFGEYEEVVIFTSDSIFYKNTLPKESSNRIFKSGEYALDIDSDGNVMIQKELIFCEEGWINCGDMRIESDFTPFTILSDFEFLENYVGDIKESYFVKE